MSRLAALLLLAAAAPLGAVDMDALLAARARAGDTAPPGRPAFAPAPPGLELFTHSAADHAVAVRAVPDVDGDQRDEVLAGIDQSGVPNVFLLDGASSGTADVVWSVQTDGGVSGGSPYGDQCLVVASDPDGNGAANLLVGTAWGGRTAYSLDALAGAEQWRFDTYAHPPESGWVYSLAELSDSTGDGAPEVAFGAGSFSDSVYAVSGASAGAATLLWRWQAPDGVVSVRNLGDADGDGEDDVLVAVGDSGHAVVALDGVPPTAAGATLWTYSTGDRSVYAVGTVEDVTGDGRRDALAVVWTIDGSAVRCLNGATGTLVWASTDVAEYGMAVDTMGDVTGDGIDEVIVSSWENAAQVLDGATGQRVWRRAVGTTNGGDVWSARRVGDLNGDGFDDVVAGSFDGSVHAFSGLNGWRFWSHPIGRRLYTVHGLGDLDGDLVPDVAAGSQNLTGSPLPVVHVLSGDGGLDLPLFADDFENAAPVGWSALVAAFD